MNLEQIKEQLDRKAAIVADVFSTPHGKEVFEMLDKANAAGDIFDADPIKMARRVGAFEVVQGLRELIARGSSGHNK